MSEKKEDFPNTVFLANLPKTFALSELSEFLESFGPIIEFEQMADEHIRIRFESSDAAKKCFVQSKKKKLEFKKKQLTVMPYNLKKKGQHP